MGARYTDEQMSKNKRFSIINGTYSAISQNILSGFLALFAIQALQATNQQIGFISSLPQMMNLLIMIPGALLMNRLMSKKRFTVITIFAARFGMFLIALIPFIPSVSHGWLLVIVVALMGIPTSLSALSWQSFIGDLIPQADRGTFFGKRNRYNTVAAMLSVLSVGILLNLFDKSNALPYQFFFLVAFAMGIMEVVYLSRHIEIGRVVESKEQAQSQAGSNFKAIFKERPFLLFVACSMLFNFGWQMAWPLFNIYNINYAHASALWISLFTVINQIAQILSFPFWGRVADKYGNMLTLFVVGSGMAILPTLTILSTNYVYLSATNFVSGLFLSGLTMLLFNQTLNVSPEEGRTSFIAGYNVAIGLVGFVAPLFGTWLLDRIGMSLAMNISTALRFSGALAFLAVAILYEKKRNRLLSDE